MSERIRPRRLRSSEAVRSVTRLIVTKPSEAFATRIDALAAMLLKPEPVR